MSTPPFTQFPIPTVDLNDGLVTATNSTTSRTLTTRFSDIVNIKDFGAVGDGVTDDTAAFMAFNAAYQGKSITLIIPPGNYPIQLGNAWATGIPELVIWGYGATVGSCSIQNVAFDQNNSHTALINTTTPGDTTVTLVNPGDSVNFSAGDWIAIGSLEMQRDNGFPPNLRNIEYKRILSISTPTITLDGTFPAYDSHIKYKNLSTYPDMGSAGSAWAGGAARIFKMGAAWNTHLRVYGLTVNQQSPFGILYQIRKVEIIDVNFENPQDPSGVAPSSTKDILFDGCSIPFVEVDKCIENITFRNCKIGTVQVQSSSVNNLIIDRCSISGGLGGTTTRNLQVRDSRAGNIFFYSEFGCSDSVTLANSYFGGLGINLGNGSIPLSLLSFSNGTFTMSKSAVFPGIQSMVQFAIPGGIGFFAGNVDTNMGNPFIIMNVRDDTNNVYMDTTLTALPTYSGAGSPVANQLILHPATNLSVTNCTGVDELLSLSQAPKSLPFRSFAHSTGMGIASGGGSVWGNIVKISLNVRRAYTGVLGTYTAQVHIPYFTSSNVRVFINDTLNTKVAGERVYLPGSTTGSQSGDSLSTIPADGWLSDGVGLLYFDGVITGENINLWPIITMTAQTDQGVTYYGSLITQQQTVW